MAWNDGSGGGPKDPWGRKKTGSTDKDTKNNRILCFSSDGEPLGELTTIGKSQKPKRPSDCFLIDQNSLFVIALDGNCYIYKLTL